jgi:CHAD domain-containing protein
MPQPVTTFLRHALLLKAALAECLDDPKPKPVHQLRSSSRRIEATLQLLITTADLPSVPKKAKALRQSLSKIRRASGKVRDIDAHRDLLATYKTITDAARMEKAFNAARKTKAQKLQRRIFEDQQDVLRALEKLETTLAPVVDLNLSGGDLAHAARSWLITSLRGLHLDPEDNNDLHSIRKACKTARYIAEIGSQTSKAASKLTARLDDIQQTTGAWHDSLLLLDEAHAILQNDSPLIEKIQRTVRQLRLHAESKAKRLLVA